MIVALSNQIHDLNCHSVYFIIKYLKIIFKNILSFKKNNFFDNSSENEVTTCIESLIHETDKRVNGCEVDGSLGRLIARSFSYNEHGWIISFVEESLLQCAWAVMTFPKRSPYVEHFNVVLRKFFESGLMQHWHDESFTNFTRNYKKYFHGHRVYLSKSARHRNLHIMQARKVPLIKKISILLGMGEAVGIVIFLGEFGWWHFKQWQVKKKR